MPMSPKLNFIKVNKINNRDNKKLKNKIENNSRKNLFNRLNFVNSTKLFKIKDKSYLTLNSDNNDKNNRNNSLYQTLKDNIKKRIISFKDINKKRISSYENKINLGNKELRKELFNKKKLLSKIDIDENTNKKINTVNKANFTKNHNIQKKSRNYNVEKIFLTRFFTNQNQFSTNSTNNSNHILTNKCEKKIQNLKKSKIDQNKNIMVKNNLMINKLKEKKEKNNRIAERYKNKNKNKIKNIDLKTNVKNNNNIVKNQNRKLLIKNRNRNKSFIITPSINMLNQEIIKYSILRNNRNNIISQAISMTLGKNDNCKKTIINVNQYYPNYYINTNNINASIEEDNKNINNNYIDSNLH